MATGAQGARVGLGQGLPAHGADMRNSDQPRAWHVYCLQGENWLLRMTWKAELGCGRSVQRTGVGFGWGLGMGVHVAHSAARTRARPGVYFPF